MDELATQSVSITAHNTLTEFTAEEWDRLNDTAHPFLSYAFLTALEQSGSVGEQTGWDILFLAAREDASALLVGALPVYVKHHSYGEYVFDHSWAHAFERAGGRYYPKLLSAVPFTPVPGPRLLYDKHHPEIAASLLAALETLARQNQISSAHMNFITADDRKILDNKGWMIRTGVQFHWQNNNYNSFDDFLASLTSRKRKTLRKERQSLHQQGVTFHQLTGADITSDHWSRFYQFYLATIEKKWGGAYLTEAFFHQIGNSMADNILLVMAEHNGQMIAGALNFIGKDTLYGRNWGCVEEIPNLHFETCYFQAIDFAISRGLTTFEAGAQGLHKVQRGYLPVYTYSAHWLADDNFSEAVSRFLRQEQQAVEDDARSIEAISPYRQDSSPQQGK